MSWTTPRTWGAETLTSSLLNTHVRDNLNHLRDVFLGSQDLGANILFSTAREIRQSDDANVTHGMTALVPTGVYGRASIFSSTAGGWALRGYSDTDAVPLVLAGIIGSASPSATIAAVMLRGEKKNGTTSQALGSGDLLVDFSNAGTTKAKIYGDGGIVSLDGLCLGFDGTPAAAQVSLGDANCLIGLNVGGSGVPGWLFDTQDAMYFTRAANTLDVYIANAIVTTHKAGCLYAVHLSLVSSTSGPSGTILFAERADPGNQLSDQAALYARDNGSGKTQLVVVFGSGAVQVLATQP